MLELKNLLSQHVVAGLKKLYELDVQEAINWQKTRKDFEGELTLVVFPYTKAARTKPEAIAEELGCFLLENCPSIRAFNVVKGFLNLSIADHYWLAQLRNLHAGIQSRITPTETPSRVMVEYSSPNTNKPLHLGHIRNNLLGYSISQIFKARGHEVVMVNLVNDRGVHICKSMLAWERDGKEETPQSSGKKGDHLVGEYYVKFDKEYQKEVADLRAKGMEEKEAKKAAPVMIETQEMLKKWEAGDKKVIDLWSKMNGWVYEGFDATYKALGVSFDKMYYESDTYLLGKKTLDEGLKSEVFIKKPDTSVWIDLTDEGLDEKLLLRNDGTSVYMTQDIGTADLKYSDYKCDRSIYVVGDEQEYHFKVLKTIMQKLGRPYADGIFHLSYGMIDLPTGRMKSREGKVVDADDLIEEMHQVAKSHTEKLGKTDGLEPAALETLYRQLSLGALKYFLLKVDPKKRMVFNPEESIDFQGNTGPFIQYNYTRIQSIERKHISPLSEVVLSDKLEMELSPMEREICHHLAQFSETIAEAEAQYSPAVVANYSFDLAKLFSQFYAHHSILKEPNLEIREFRLALLHQVSLTLKDAGNMLGMEMPDRM